MNILQAVRENIPVRILPYKAGSVSAGLLTDYINTTYNAKARQRVRDAVTTPGINLRWGKSPVRVENSIADLNVPDAVATAANKSATLNTLAINNVPCVESTTSSERAAGWLQEGLSVVCRHTLYGHSGKGIQIVEQSGTVYRSSELSDRTPWYAGKLFTKYFKRAAEYRVFVVGQSAVLAYRKGAATQPAEATRQFMVRTHATGWNFCAVAMSDVPQQVLEASVRAVNALGLHFGAVDVGWNDHHARAAVFEVNTAPGMQGSTVPVIADALVQLDLAPVVAIRTDTVTVALAHDEVPMPESLQAAPAAEHLQARVERMVRASRDVRIQWDTNQFVNADHFTTRIR